MHLTLLAALLLARSSPADRTVRGEVRTADGAKVVGATVWVVGTRAPNDSMIAATTDGLGAYRFTLPMSETSALVVRRRGFSDARVAVPFDAKGSAKKPVNVEAVTLTALAAPAISVVVADTGNFVGASSPFFRRVAARRGTYLTRADMARLSATRTSTLLRGMSGVTLIGGSGGGSYAQLRGRNCLATIWIDGSSIGNRAYDVDLISPQSLSGIEVYATPGDLPAEYQNVESMNCGALGFWTRRGEDNGSLEPSSVMEPTTVRGAKEVEQTVQLLEGSKFAPTYPAEARAAGLDGDVLIEFVVDTTGAVERSSVGVVAAPSPELVEPVLRAATRLRFAPARASGRPVRQLVHAVAHFQTKKK